MPPVSQSHESSRLYQGMKETLFYIALGTLFAHELDAVLNSEWRVMPFLNLLPDDQGMVVFIVSHIPLFSGIVALVASRVDKIRRMVRVVICSFLVIHGGLHLGFSNDPAYEFDAVLSSVLIYAAAATGALYLVLAVFDTISQTADL